MAAAPRRALALAACLAVAAPCVLGAASVSAAAAPAPAELKGGKARGPSLWDLHKALAGHKFVDLTHAFSPGIPRWKGFPDERRRTLYNYTRHGFWAETYTLVGQWGTHVDPPAHFHQGLRTVDEIAVEEMIAPLVVIDISERASRDPDTVVIPQDIKDWEARYGRIPEKSFVACRSGWSRRWPEILVMQNRDNQGVMHYPGWSVDAIRLLAEERKIAAVGHETTDTDPGVSVSADRYPAQAYLHGQDLWQIELLANLDGVPEYGALVVASFPKPKRGSGFPARVFAILP